MSVTIYFSRTGHSGESIDYYHLVFSAWNIAQCKYFRWKTKTSIISCDNFIAVYAIVARSDRQIGVIGYGKLHKCSVIYPFVYNIIFSLCCGFQRIIGRCPGKSVVPILAFD